MANIPTHDSTNLRTGEGAVGSNSFSMDTSVTTKIYPEGAFLYRSSTYAMDTNVVTKVYPSATFTYTFNEPATTYTLVGDGTSIVLTWQDGTPVATFVMQGDATLTFAQPSSILRFRQNSVVEGSYGITLTPNSDFLLTKPNYIDGQNSIWLRPASSMEQRARSSVSGSSLIRLTPRATLWAFNGIVTGRRFVPGYFATKSAGSVDNPSDTRAKLLVVVNPLFSRDLTHKSINDLWMYFFDTEHVPEGSINDRMAYWLRYEKGVSGDSINDLMANWDGTL